MFFVMMRPFLQEHEGGFGYAGAFKTFADAEEAVLRKVELSKGYLTKGNFLIAEEIV